MSRIIDLILREILTIIHRMGDLAYRVISMAIDESFYGNNSYDEIKEISDTLIMLADQVEDKAFETIVRFQPVASDLRAIMSYVKISYDFTRFGRYALNISYVNKHFGGLKECKEWIRSYAMDMSYKALSMIKMSIEALKSQKAEIVKDISEIEKEVDKLYFEFLDKIIKEKNIENKIIVSSVLTIRYFERIADHAAYVCESIIYTLTGKKEFLR